MPLEFRFPTTIILGGCRCTPPFFWSWEGLQGGYMDLEAAAKNLLTPMGFEVLELRILGDSRNREILLRIDKLNEEIVSIDDVSLVANVFGLELDQIDPFEEAYNLNVESPGSKRPLITKRHFERFIDLKAKVKTPKKTIVGVIKEVNEDSVGFLIGKNIEAYKYAEIKANLAEWPKTPR